MTWPLPATVEAGQDGMGVHGGRTRRRRAAALACAASFHCSAADL